MFPPLRNVLEWIPQYYNDDTATSNSTITTTTGKRSHHHHHHLHRSKDPGAGAFSPYWDRRSSAGRDIHAGEELFVDYGIHWFEGRASMRTVPLLGDLEHATDLARSSQRLASLPLQSDRAGNGNRRDHQVSSSSSLTILEDVWDIFVIHSHWKDQSRVLGAFHSENAHQERQLLQDQTMTQLRIKDSTRSIEWLQQYGTCADHIRVQPSSTLPQAGRGGFAARDLRAGTVVAPMPLIHILNRHKLRMYDLNQDPTDEATLSNAVMGQQLLLNYCFGHRESTLLLCPYGPMASYINHNATLVNVKIRWADPQRGNHSPTLLNRSLSALDTDATAKLAFDLVALRDIAQGEELFLDYGVEWEKAWWEHVAQPRSGETYYVPAWQLNGDHTQPLYTVFEGIHGRLYPQRVDIRCDKAFLDHSVTEWEDAIRNERLQTWLFHNSQRLLPCEILRRKNWEGRLLYTVVMMEEYENDENGQPQLNNHIVEDIPREGIKFVDRPYTSDLFLPGAFRHDIRIPDKMFPDSWRNLRSPIIDRYGSGEVRE